jgi:hypothetical protein
MGDHMPLRQRAYRWIVTLVLITLLAACGAEEAEPTPAAKVEEPATAEPPIPEDSDADEDSGSTSEPTAEGEAPAATNAPEDGSNASPGNYAADLGFRPDTHGFAFPNYGGEGETNLTPNELRRMFGDRVCARIQGDQCILTPPGEQWLQEINQAMDGGHCEGMAVLSNMFYTGKASPTDFGAATVPQLDITGNEPLQREIAYWWATQSTQPARQGIVEQTPSGVINTLLTSFAAGPTGSEQYAVGFYKRDHTGGHAVTPYAVEDRGNGIYWIMIYDNNFPGVERAIEVNTNNDTWTYSGSTNPAEQEDLYEGDADTKTLELAPIGPRFGQQECPFCDVAPSGMGGGKYGAAPFQQVPTQYNQIWLDGDADLLITDVNGQSIGFQNGSFINQIPGATSNGNKYGVNVWDITAEPVYSIPSDIDFTISIDGSRLTDVTTSTVTMIGPGYALEVSEIVLSPGDVDTLDVAPDGSLLLYRSASGSTPFLLMAIETDAADYMFGVYGEEMVPGEALSLSLDPSRGWLSIDTIDTTTQASYGMYVAKYDENGEQIFGTDAVVLDPEDIVYVDYLQWPGNGQPMELEVDEAADGSIDATITIDDVTDTIE